MATKGIDDRNSWVVAWASFIVKVLSQGIMNVRGLFFLATISRFNTDRQQASVPFILCLCLRGVTGPFVSCFGNRYGLRKVTLLGCIGSSIAVVASFFAESVAVLTILWGIALGISVGFSNTLIPVILNEHFEKHKVKANGLNIAGSSFGLLALSPVIDFLINTYGISGTFLITGGLMLNSIPAALIMLYKEQSLSMDNLSKCSAISIENCGTLSTSLKCAKPLLQLSDNKYNISQDESSCISDNPKMEGICGGSISAIDAGEVFNPIEPFDQMHVKLCGINQSGSLHSECNSRIIIGESSSLDTSSSLSVGQAHLDRLADEQHEFHGKKLSEKIKNSAGCLRQENSVCRESVTLERHTSSKENVRKPGLLHFLTQADIFLLLCDCKFLLFAIGGASYAFMNATFLLIIADFAIDQGMHPSNAKYLFIWISTTDIVARLCLGWVTDNGYVSKKNFIGLGFAFACVSNLVTVWSSGSVALLLSVTFFELAQCAIAINLFPAIAEFIRKDLQTSALSSAFVMSAPIVFGISPMIGFFRDGMKSYTGVFYVIATLNFLCASLFLCVPMSPASN